MCRQELREEESLELVVSHSSTTLHLHQGQEGDWRTYREIHWNCRPLSVLPAFPYILAVSADTLEIRQELAVSLTNDEIQNFTL